MMVYKNMNPKESIFDVKPVYRVPADLSEVLKNLEF